MPQIYAQQVFPPEAWQLVGPITASRLHLTVPTVLKYSVLSGSPPANDTLAAYVDAQLIQSAGPVFDRTYLYVVFTLAGSSVLSLCLRSQLDVLDTLVTGQWTVLGKVTATHVLDWQA